MKKLLSMLILSALLIASLGEAAFAETQAGAQVAQAMIDLQKASVKPTAVRLNRKSATLMKGETLQLEAKVAPARASQAVTWRSSNPKIATVDENGKVTARGEGLCRIRATPAGRKKPFAYLKLTVTEGQAPTDIEVTAPASTLGVGRMMTLTAKITPEDASDNLVWTTSNEKIAAVSQSGVVTGKREGTVKIRVSSAARKTVYDDVRLTIVDPTRVTSVAIDAEDFYLDKGKSKQLKATIEPAGSEAEVKWSSSAQTVASVTTSGKVTGLKAGTATITASAGGKSDSVSVTVLTDERVSSEPDRYVTSASAIGANREKIQAVFASAMAELENAVSRKLISSSERAQRKEFLQRGFIMYDVAWTPKSSATYWHGGSSYLPGRIYFGMPYTQGTKAGEWNNRKYNLTKWLNAVPHTQKGGYYLVSLPSTDYPGNDCSSFVSMCQFGVNSAYSFLDTRTMYISTQYKTVTNGFTQMIPGDVLVKNGHTCMFLYYVTTDKIMVLEQGGGSEPNTIDVNVKTISGTYRPQYYRVRRRADLPSAG